MRLGLRLPQRVGTDLRHGVTAVARAAEQAGFDSLWAWERLLFPVSPRSSLTPGEPWPPAYRQAADPLVVLTAAAVVTERVRLGTSVLIAGLHRPLQLAKSMATLDQVSGGRFVAGLGTGWAVDEFDAVDADVTRRGRLLDETLDVLRAAWGPDPVSYRGPHTLIDDAYVLPKPAGRIPVLLGGDVDPTATSGPRARVLDRIARRADGWLPIPSAPGRAGAERLRTAWDAIHQAAAAAGRDPSAMELVVVGNVAFSDSPAGPARSAFSGTRAQVLDDVAAAADAGADELIIDLHLQDWWRDTAQMLDEALEIRALATAAGV
ncbi:LLM class F420-dependent oxidoreductase [Promicromonospora sukumoe]|uniref:Putative F420-dependent oxidoreductase n=1 Tax=Promicromonospora sukumoe TaxID=88382 RepID=A0A7W3PE56_9MICO|nr:TIGR03619 family F420-dependent LLM class oxidoreductase [Promicromonospora sukumoe]MBA8808406.1 putative F420-dependent oxidoreductase [Promicromonospora sukumoe]